MYLVVLSKLAEKDKKLLKAAGFERKARELLDIIAVNPFHSPPQYKKLTRDLRDKYSRRINIKHRLVYSIEPNTCGLAGEDGKPYEGIILVERMWGHYGD